MSDRALQEVAPVRSQTAAVPLPGIGPRRTRGMPGGRRVRAPSAPGFVADFSRVPVHARDGAPASVGLGAGARGVDGLAGGRSLDRDIAVSRAVAATGRSVEASVRAPVEAQLGVDLGDARLHSGPLAAAAADLAGARALALGPHVVLGREESHAPSSRELIAHELAHVAQWKVAGTVRGGWSSPGDPLERHADRVARAATSPGQVTAGPQPGGPVPAVSCQKRGRTAPPPAAAQTPAQKIVAAAQASDPGGTGEPSTHAFDLIMSQYFPGPARDWSAGVRFEAAEPKVRADTPNGRGGKAPFVVGAQFARDTTAERLDDRVRDVRQALVGVFNWRFGQGILTAADIAIPLVLENLRETRDVALHRIRDEKGVEPAARALIDRLLISTPLPGEAKFAGDGSTTLTVNGLSVKVLPDLRQGAENLTSSDRIPNGVSVPSVTTLDGRIDEILGDLPQAPSIVIQTTYAATGDLAAEVPSTANSAYGRGKTEADIKKKDTSLRFHEGSHGSDTLDFLAKNKFPKFKGRKGMTAAAWTAAQEEFLAAYEKWTTAMDLYSLCKTDCVGLKTIDDVNSAKAGYKLQCPACRPPRPSAAAAPARH